MKRLKLLVLTGLICFIAPALNAQTGQISGLLNKITVHTGETFNVVWYADPGDNPVAVIDFVLTYEPDFLGAQEVQRVPSSPLNAHQTETKIDENAGQIIFGVFQLSQPWPDTLFAFVKTEFTARKATPNTALAHDLSKPPYTLMAHAGNNTMANAENITVAILPEIDLQATTAFATPPNFTVESGENGVAINFGVEKMGTTTLRLRNADDVLISELIEMTAGPGIDYTFGINDTMLEPGTYVVELQDASGTRTQLMQVED